MAIQLKANLDCFTISLNGKVPAFDKGGRGDIEKGFVILSHRLAVLGTSLDKGGLFGLLYSSPKDD